MLFVDYSVTSCIPQSYLFLFCYLLVKSCLLITLIKCFKCFSILVHSDVLCRLKYLVVTARQTKGKVTYWAILDN